MLAFNNNNKEELLIPWVRTKKNFYNNKISKYCLNFILHSLDVGVNSEQRRPLLGSVGPPPSYNSVASSYARQPPYNYSGARPSTSANLVTPVGVHGVAVGGVPAVGVGGAPGGGVTVVNIVEDYTEDNWPHRNRHHHHHIGGFQSHHHHIGGFGSNNGIEIGIGIGIDNFGNDRDDFWNDRDDFWNDGDDFWR